jgi:hypothetical protein
MRLASKFPEWFRATPFGEQVEAERDAARRETHDALVAEAVAVGAEAERDRPALERTLAAATSKAEKAKAILDAGTVVRREAALALRAFERALEQRLLLIEKQLAATADPRLEAVAALVLEEVVAGLRSGALGLANGEKRGVAAKRFQDVALVELRQRAVLAPTADAIAAIRAVRAEVLESLDGPSRAEFERRFEQILDAGEAA